MSTSANPRHPDNHPASADPSVPQETTGPIASDSLAAESLKSGGDFAAGDSSAVPLGVKGANSTLNTTDTSGATPLAPAADGTQREKLNAKGLGSDEKGVAGVKYPEGAGDVSFDGKHTAGGEYYGGPSGDKGSSAAAGQPAGASDFGASTTTTTSSSGNTAPNTTSSGTSNQTSSSSTSQTTTGPSTSATSSATAAGVRPHVDAAPNYAARVSGAISNENESKPKGEGLIEGGDVPEGKKTFVGAVTGPNDPGRLAEQGFEQINADVAGGGKVGGGPGPKEGETEVGGQYGVLESKKL
jgi:hypothetical protein